MNSSPRQCFQATRRDFTETSHTRCHFVLPYRIRHLIREAGGEANLPDDALREVEYLRQAARFALTPEDLDLLLFIGRHGVVESCQIDRAFGHRHPRGLRRRLFYLFHNGFLHRPKAQKKNPSFADRGDGAGRGMIYVLARRGTTALRKARGIDLQGYAPDATLPSLEHELGVTDFMLEASLSSGGDVRLIWLDEILRRTGDAAPPRMNVALTEPGGRRKELSLKPDRILSFEVSDGVEARYKNFYVEYDRGTMPIDRPGFSQSSIVRKYYAYSDAYRRKHHLKHFDFQNIRTLFVAPSAIRVENMLAAFERHQSSQDIVSPNVFLFADWPTIAETPLFEVPWRRGDGSTVRLLD